MAADRLGGCCAPPIGPRPPAGRGRESRWGRGRRADLGAEILSQPGVGPVPVGRCATDLPLKLVPENASGVAPSSVAFGRE